MASSRPTLNSNTILNILELLSLNAVEWCIAQRLPWEARPQQFVSPVLQSDIAADRCSRLKAALIQIGFVSAKQHVFCAKSKTAVGQFRIIAAPEVFQNISDQLFDNLVQYISTLKTQCDTAMKPLENIQNEANTPQDSLDAGQKISLSGYRECSEHCQVILIAMRVPRLRHYQQVDFSLLPSLSLLSNNSSQSLDDPTASVSSQDTNRDSQETVILGDIVMTDSPRP